MKIRADLFVALLLIASSFIVVVIANDVMAKNSVIAEYSTTMSEAVTACYKEQVCNWEIILPTETA